MQSRRVTSGPRQHVLTRSRSLAFPLTEIDHVGAADAHSADTTTGKEKAIVSSMLITEKNSFDDEDDPETLRDLGKPLKKSMRRQKSFAELLGVALYKSKVHLHELFSRRGRPGQPWQEKTGDKPVLNFHPPFETMMSEDTDRGMGLELKSDDRTGTSASSVLEAGPGNVRQPKLVPREPVIMGVMNRHILSADEDVNQKRRVPEELFCVTGEVSQAEEFEFTPGLKVLPPHNPNDLKHSSRHKPNRKLPSSDNDSKAKTALVNSNSDGLWNLRCPKPASDACLEKASSYTAQQLKHKPSNSFVPRPPGSRRFLSRDSKVGIVTTNVISPPLSNTVAPDCINSVMDWLWLGSVEAAYNEPLLCNLKVDAIVDISNVDAHCVPAEKKTTCPCTCSKTHFCTKLNVAVDDIEWENIDQYFADANAFIGGWRQRGSRVLVVSYHGKSRGPAFVIQHLMHHYRIPLERALGHVKSCRPQTRINPGFLRVLQRLDKHLASQRDFSGLAAPEFPDQVFTRPKTAWDEC